MRAFIKNHIVVISLLLILSIPLTVQLFQPGFFVGDDGEWMIIRSSAFHEALRDGQFPVRFLGRLNHEFGYPVATFLYPGYLYLTEPFVILGFSFIDAIKIMFTLTMIISGIFAYFWLSKLFDKWSAFIGGLIYLYTPYHLIDMYKRGSLGELLALAVVPFILWNIERKSLFFSVIGLMLLILSHNIMAALFLPIVLIYTFIRYEGKVKQKLLWTSLLTALSLGMSSFFWIPAVFELSNTVFNQTKISEWQNYFATFAQIGGLPLVILITAMGLIIFQKNLSSKKSLFKVSENKVLLYFFSIIGVASVVLSSYISTIFWNILPVTFIQFPFRFLSVEIIAVSFLAAFIVYAIQNKTFKIIYTAIILIALVINALPYMTNIDSFDKGEGFYITNQSTTTTRDEYMPIWVKDKPVQRAEEKIVVVKGNADVSNQVINNKRIMFNINAESPSTIQLNKIYWPGWIADIDGNATEINYDNPKGLMNITIPQGSHSVVFTFEETPLRLAADIVSVISIVGLVIISFLKRKHTKQTKNNRK